MNWLGDYPEDHTTVVCMFTTHDDTGAPVAPNSAFEAADVLIFKNGSATEKTTTNGVTMTSPFNSITGLHAVAIDTSNDTGDGGFWVTGAVYTLVLSADETVDGVAVTKVIGQFGIELSAAAGAAPSAADIADAVWDEDATLHQTQGTFGQAIGDPAADANTIYAAVVTGAAGATIAADIIAIKAETADIYADTQNIRDGVEVTSFSAAGIANLFDTDCGETYAGAVAGSLVKEIADNAGGSSLTAAAIADAVWDEVAGGHQTQGTFGQTLGDSVADTASVHAYAAASYVHLDTTVVPIVGTILADTNELQGDWVNGGRLDNILDARASQTSVDDLPTNAELAASQASADDATLAAIAALNNLSAAQVNAEVDTALADYDGPTHAELVSEINAVQSDIAGLNDVTAAAVADAVWLETLADHSGSAGSTAAALNAAGSAGDPWQTALPGAYGAGTAGKIVGDNLNAPVGTVDTVVDAIKLKTDSLTFTVAGQVDANIQYVNDVQIQGTGVETTDEWRPV
jgi:hypothetical protein